MIIMIHGIKRGYHAVRHKAEWRTNRDGKSSISRKRVPSWDVNHNRGQVPLNSNPNIFSKYSENDRKLTESQIKEIQKFTEKDWAEAREDVKTGKMTHEQYAFGRAIAEKDYKEALRQRDIMADKPWSYGLSGKSMGKALEWGGVAQKAIR